MKKLTISGLIVVSAILLCTSPSFGGVFDDVFDCIDTFDSANADCTSARQSCYTACSGSSNPQSCMSDCDGAFSTCITDAAIGGALGLPQGFSACLNSATSQEPMLESDATYLYNLCASDCGLRRDECLAMGDGEWDDDCFTMSASCQMSCFEIGPLNF